jgi:hypothetical protein
MINRKLRDKDILTQILQKLGFESTFSKRDNTPYFKFNDITIQIFCIESEYHAILFYKDNIYGYKKQKYGFEDVIDFLNDKFKKELRIITIQNILYGEHIPVN